MTALNSTDAGETGKGMVAICSIGLAHPENNVPVKKDHTSTISAETIGSRFLGQNGHGRLELLLFPLLTMVILYAKPINSSLRKIYA
jgi:hypothetical protein